MHNKDTPTRTGGTDLIGYTMFAEYKGDKEHISLCLLLGAVSIGRRNTLVFY